MGADKSKQRRVHGIRPSRVVQWQGDARPKPSDARPPAFLETKIVFSNGESPTILLYISYVQLKRKKVRLPFRVTIVAPSVRFTPATVTPWLRVPAGGRVEKIKIKKGFLMQMYKRERIYKSG
jgi:hypothetical protein